MPGEKRCRIPGPSRVDFDDLGGFCEPRYLSKFRRRRASSFDLYFHSGFHFLLFSVRLPRFFSSHVTKRIKGLLLSRPETQILISTPRFSQEKKRDGSSPFYSIFMQLLSMYIRHDAFCAEKKNHWSANFRGQTRPTIAEQTIRANNLPRTRHVRCKRDSAPSVSLSQTRQTRLYLPCGKIKTTRR